VALEIVVGGRSDGSSLRSFIKCLNQFLPAALTTENGFEIVFWRTVGLLIGLLEKGPSASVHVHTPERGAFCSNSGRVAAAGETPHFSFGGFCQSCGDRSTSARSLSLRKCSE
jgi:hypothetical protein